MDIKQIGIKMARATTLPVLSHVALEMVHVVDKQDATAKDYERILSQDAGIVSKLLRTANSAHYGNAQQVSTINRALAVLGANTVRSICLTVAFQSALSNKKLDKRFDTGRFWRHSLATGCAAKVLARLTSAAEPEVAYTAGLVHDVGKLAIAMFLPEETAKIFDLVEAENLPHFEAEKIILEATHQQVGLVAAEQWNLPITYHKAVGYHHTPLQCGSELDALTALVQISNALADDIGFSFSPPGDCNRPDYICTEFLNLPDEQYEAIQGAVRNAVVLVSKQLGVDLELEPAAA